MSQQDWHGIPRKEIPWHPTIDYKKCISCGKCVEYCALGTFEFEDKNGKKRPIVRNQENCVVLCSGCDSICPPGAISHPSKKETREVIRNLRKTHGLHNENREKIKNLQKAQELHLQKKAE